MCDSNRKSIENICKDEELNKHNYFIIFYICNSKDDDNRQMESGENTKREKILYIELLT